MNFRSSKRGSHCFVKFIECFSISCVSFCISCIAWLELIALDIGSRNVYLHCDEKDNRNIVVVVADKNTICLTIFQVQVPNEVQSKGLEDNEEVEVGLAITLLVTVVLIFTGCKKMSFFVTKLTIIFGSFTGTYLWCCFVVTENSGLLRPLPVQPAKQTKNLH